MGRLLVTLLCTLGLGACTTDGTQGLYKTYKPSEVIANVAAFRGRTIHVRGYLVLGDEAHGLWDSAHDVEYLKSVKPGPEDPAWGRCMTAYYTDDGAKAIGRNHPRNMTVIGKIGENQSRNTIDFGSCSDVHITIEQVIPEKSRQ